MLDDRCAVCGCRRQEWLSVKEVALSRRVSTSTVQRWAKRRRISSRRRGRRIELRHYGYWGLDAFLARTGALAGSEREAACESIAESLATLAGCYCAEGDWPALRGRLARLSLTGLGAIESSLDKVVEMLDLES